jgi:hypothetical protein
MARHHWVVAVVAAAVIAGCGSTISSHGQQADSPSPPVAASVGAAGGQLPASGRGWDAQNVYVGVITENDAQKVTQGLGLTNLDPGNQEFDAQTVANSINAAGGIFGRKLVLKFYDEATFALLASPDTQAASACTHFTQDQPVIAVVNSVTIIDTPVFKSCFADNHVPLFEGSQQPTDTKALNGLGGYVVSVLSPSYTDMAPVLVARLKAEGYFTRWNTATGQPGSAPVKVGLLTPHDPTGFVAAGLLSKALARAGYPPAATYSYSSSGAGSGTEASAAVQFRAKGITHVIGTGLNSYLFMTPAETQGYRPRYGVSTFNAPGVLLQNNVPKPQLSGALGIGVDPTADVDTAHDPGIVSASERSCLATMHAVGQNFNGRRLAEAVALFDCDVFHLIRLSALAGGGLTPATILRGVGIAGPRFVPAETFSSGLAPGQLALAGSARDLAWSTGCECFHYTSTTDHPFGAG